MEFWSWAGASSWGSKKSNLCSEALGSFVIFLAASSIQAVANLCIGGSWKLSLALSFASAMGAIRSKGSDVRIQRSIKGADAAEAADSESE